MIVHFLVMNSRRYKIYINYVVFLPICLPLRGKILFNLEGVVFMGTYILASRNLEISIE